MSFEQFAHALASGSRQLSSEPSDHSNNLYNGSHCVQVATATYLFILRLLSLSRCISSPISTELPALCQNVIEFDADTCCAVLGIVDRVLPRQCSHELGTAVVQVIAQVAITTCDEVSRSRALSIISNILDTGRPDLLMRLEDGQCSLHVAKVLRLQDQGTRRYPPLLETTLRLKGPVLDQEIDREGGFTNTIVLEFEAYISALQDAVDDTNVGTRYSHAKSKANSFIAGLSPSSGGIIFERTSSLLEGKSNLGRSFLALT